jgi:cytochrome b pre-mRNA-processing protein 3
MYDLCKDRYDVESSFLLQECHLPSTYQTWFQITNIHIWLLTIRLRTLPPSHGRVYVQELINHFFLGVEDRMRAVLGPKAPDRVVRSYMKEMRDQWAGVGMALDMSLVVGDRELAATIWRNVFGARTGGRAETSAESKEGSAPAVVDADADAKVAEQLYYFVAYLRREAKRLEMISDEDVIAGRVGEFGKFKAEEDLLLDGVDIKEHQHVRVSNTSSLPHSIPSSDPSLEIHRVAATA